MLRRDEHLVWIHSGSEALVQRTFKLSARISSDNPSAVKPVLERLISGKGKIKAVEDGFKVEADLEGETWPRPQSHVIVRDAQSGEKNQNTRRMDFRQYDRKVLRLRAKGNSKGKLGT